MNEPWSEKVRYNGGEIIGFKTAESLPFTALVVLLAEHHAPITATITAQCDHYDGPEGPIKVIEVTWEVDDGE